MTDERTHKSANGIELVSNGTITDNYDILTMPPRDFVCRVEFMVDGEWQAFEFAPRDAFGIGYLNPRIRDVVKQTPCPLMGIRFMRADDGKWVEHTRYDAPFTYDDMGETVLRQSFYTWLSKTTLDEAIRPKTYLAYPDDQQQ